MPEDTPATAFIKHVDFLKIINWPQLHPRLMSPTWYSKWMQVFARNSSADANLDKGPNPSQVT